MEEEQLRSDESWNVKLGEGGLLVEDAEELMRPEAERGGRRGVTRRTPSRPKPTGPRSASGKARARTAVADDPRFKQISFYLSREEYFALLDESRARKHEDRSPDTHQGIAKEYLRDGLTRAGRLKA